MAEGSLWMNNVSVAHPPKNPPKMDRVRSRRSAFVARRSNVVKRVWCATPSSRCGQYPDLSIPSGTGYGQCSLSQLHGRRACQQPSNHLGPGLVFAAGCQTQRLAKGGGDERAVDGDDLQTMSSTVVCERIAH